MFVADNMLPVSNLDTEVFAIGTLSSLDDRDTLLLSDIL